MTFGKGRISIGDDLTLDSNWWFDSISAAVAAAEKWDTETEKEPCGWFRHIETGRRRPDGDPAKEYINW